MTSAPLPLRDQLAASLRAAGARFDAEVLGATRSLLKPHLDMTPAAREEVDVAYGADPRHRLDLYLPTGPARAVVVFVHGGGFVAGNKNADGTFYVNVGRWLARQGFVAVLPNYRLAPDHPWPAGTQDVAAVVNWVQGAGRAQLGTSAPTFVWGQSAGAAHVSSWFFDDAARGGPRAQVAGVLLMSGLYQVADPQIPGVKAYFGDDASLYPQRSPLTHVLRDSTPLWTSVAELDPPMFHQQVAAFAQAYEAANGRPPVQVTFAGHNHVSTVQSLCSQWDDSGQAVRAFIDTVLAANAVA